MKIWIEENTATGKSFRELETDAPDNYKANRVKPVASNDSWGTRFRAMNADAHKALAQASLLRHEPWSNPAWVSAYKTFLTATNEKYKSEGIAGFRNMGCFFTDRCSYMQKGLHERTLDNLIKRETQGLAR